MSEDNEVGCTKGLVEFAGITMPAGDVLEICRFVGNGIGRVGGVTFITTLADDLLRLLMFVVDLSIVRGVRGCKGFGRTRGIL